MRPEIAILANFRAKRRIDDGESGDFACTYNGSDPTEDLMMALTDALIAYERLRVEAMAPLLESPGNAPARFSAVASELLPLDTAIVESISRAVRINEIAWSDRFR